MDGVNIMLQAFLLHGKIVCREIAEGEHGQEQPEGRQQSGCNVRQRHEVSSNRPNSSMARSARNPHPDVDP